MASSMATKVTIRPINTNFLSDDWGAQRRYRSYVNRVATEFKAPATVLISAAINAAAMSPRNPTGNR